MMLFARVLVVVWLLSACSGGGSPHGGDDGGPLCGDGVIQVGTDEECDDGNRLDGDECEADCRLPFCGNGIVDASELCDDGNNAEHDGCAPDCTSTCGDGFLDPNETCDDGNRLEGDGCRFDCTVPSCHDGVAQPGDICFDGQTRVSYVSPDLMVEFVAADFDADGDLDLLVLKFSSLALYRNTAGSFIETTQISFPQQAQRAHLAAGDLDNDGDIDAVMVRPRSDFVNDIVVALNDGSGMLSVHQTIPGSEVPIRLADLDLDGDRDIVFVNASGFGQITNDGTGTFTGAPPPAFSPTDFELADLDGDNDLDGAKADTGAVRLYKNNGGTFTLVETFNDPNARAVEFGDLDGDGDIDLAYTANLKLNIRKNNGAGVLTAFSSTDVYDYDANGLSLADYDGDGDRDALVGTYSLAVMMNDGAGTFTTAFTAEAGTGACAGDLDSNGRSDIVALAHQQELVISFDDGASAVNPLLVPGAVPIHRAFADIDGDGDTDLLVAESNPIDIAIYKNDGGGRYTQSTTVSSNPSTDYPRRLAVGDLDHDGDIDAVAVHDVFNTIQVLRNDGAGTFSESDRISVGAATTGLLLADLTGDGYLDAVLFGGYQLRFYAGTPTGTFLPSPQLLPTMSTTIQGVRSADIDGDGAIDLVIQWPQGLDVAYNDGAGGFAQRVTAVQQQAFLFDVGDIDGDGRVDLVHVQPPYVRIFRNLDGRLFEPHTIEVVELMQTKSLGVGDIDARGGVEVLLGEEDRQIHVIGLTDPKRFEERLRFDAIYGEQLYSADVNGDGVGDIAAEYFRIAVFRARP